MKLTHGSHFLTRPMSYLGHKVPTMMLKICYTNTHLLPITLKTDFYNYLKCVCGSTLFLGLKVPTMKFTHSSHFLTRTMSFLGQKQ
jgi:hypothetical protein